MQPAARVGDMHVCPALNPGAVPHVGGSVLRGAATVLIGGVPAARMGDQTTCAGCPDTILQGSPTVFISGQPAARLGDQCSHGGKVIMGYPTVLIN